MNIEEFNECYTPEPYSGCWLWLRAISKGYGHVNRSKLKDKAHRIAWRLFNGEIPKGKLVLHRCDTPSCVNPAHLFLGTDGDNMRDRNFKGRTRGAYGELNRHAKLTWSQVDEIRCSTLGNIALGKQYGVKTEAISRIRKGERWALRPR